MLLLRVKTGSHLYGLAHDGSDEDWVEVYSVPEVKRAREYRPTQNIREGQDVVRMNLSVFMHRCDMAVPQMLEVMFAPCPDYDLITNLRNSYYVNTAQAHHVYTRTIRKFRLQAIIQPARREKLLRTADRLEWDLTNILMHGRFDPTSYAKQRRKHG